MTVFSDPTAVETWDACFRWRNNGKLLDVTINDTWQRVANDLIVAETSNKSYWHQQFIDMFSGWRLLPDERLLRHAGTGLRYPLQQPRALLNAGAFVIGSSRPNFELQRFISAATLAVRLLDNALLLSPYYPGDDGGLNIGVIGLGDALTRLGQPYDSPASHRQARVIITALADGCLSGNMQLARERGARGYAGLAVQSRWYARGTPSELIRDCRRWGYRYRDLTAIDRQPRLALLANRASDAIDPHVQPPPTQVHTPRPILGRMPTADVSNVPVEPVHAAPNDALLNELVAQLELRAALQPWVDYPIQYPLRITTPMPSTIRVECEVLARRLGLGALRWTH